jgi:hypothetical protein
MTPIPSLSCSIGYQHRLPAQPLSTFSTYILSTNVFLPRPFLYVPLLPYLPSRKRIPSHGRQGTTIRTIRAITTSWTGGCATASTFKHQSRVFQDAKGDRNHCKSHICPGYQVRRLEQRWRNSRRRGRGVEFASRARTTTRSCSVMADDRRPS